MNFKNLSSCSEELGLEYWSSLTNSVSQRWNIFMPCHLMQIGCPAIGHDPFLSFLSRSTQLLGSTYIDTLFLCIGTLFSTKTYPDYLVQVIISYQPLSTIQNYLAQVLILVVCSRKGTLLCVRYFVPMNKYLVFYKSLSRLPCIGNYFVSTISHHPELP